MEKDLKDLLLKDICMRLPYGTLVYAQNDMDWYESEICTQVFSDVINEDYIVKPYLFPLSSMTEEQKKELQTLMIRDSYGILYHTLESFNYMCKNNIDFRGLIPMGLANDATGLNIY